MKEFYDEKQETNIFYDPGSRVALYIYDTEGEVIDILMGFNDIEKYVRSSKWDKLKNDKK